MLKVQGIVTKHCQTWKKLIPTVKIWGKNLDRVKGTCCPAPKQNCHKLSRQWSNSKEKRKSFICYNHMLIWALKHYPECTFFFSSCEQIRSRHPGCLSLFLFLYSIQIMSAVLLWSYDWSSATIVNLTEQATHVPKTRVLTSVNSNLSYYLHSLTRFYLINTKS